MNGNLVIGRVEDDAEMVSVYGPDVSMPMLVDTNFGGFVDIDLSNETLTLEFNETVNVSSFRASSIVLKAFWFGNSLEDTIQLTGPDGVITPTDNTTVTFQLTVFDLNRIKQNRDVCTQVEPVPN